MLLQESCNVNPKQGLENASTVASEMPASKCVSMHLARGLGTLPTSVRQQQSTLNASPCAQYSNSNIPMSLLWSLLDARSAPVTRLTSSAWLSSVEAHCAGMAPLHIAVAPVTWWLHSGYPLVTRWLHNGYAMFK